MCISCRADRDDIVEYFYILCLARSILYCCAVGYFTISSLAFAARNAANLVACRGKMQLVASPHLEEAEYFQVPFHSLGP